MMIELQRVPRPERETGLQPVILSDETMRERKEKILGKMTEKGLDALVVYADLEHGNNFEYLTGFLPRFEEALLILFRDGTAELLLGNENLNKAPKSRIRASAIHVPYFSLPNQPMYGEKRMEDILRESRLCTARHIGLAGWKLFREERKGAESSDCQYYDLPYYLVNALITVCPGAEFRNAADIFIGKEGVRRTNSAEELAHYEFGAALAGRCMLDTLDRLEEGMSEMEAAETLSGLGQPHSVITIMAAGERFIKANLYPGTRKIRIGDRLSLTVGYKGGLQSRAGYAVRRREELPEGEEDFLEAVAAPYFGAVKAWVEQIHVGMTGGELYRLIETVLPRAAYGWSLNPGHLCADEEWLCSPVYEDSEEPLQSGMLLQIDIIPSVKGYGGINCESGVMLADQALREEIQEKFPEMWARIRKRRKYMKEVLGLNISEEVLPTSSMTAFCCPFLLDKESALVNVG